MMSPPSCRDRGGGPDRATAAERKAPARPGRDDADADAAAWLGAHASALHQALFDAESYRDEHGLPAEGDRADFDELAAELAALAGLDLEEPT